MALRPEPFGALAYHYGNRKLNFLRSPELVHLVGRLHEFESVRSAFEGTGLDPAKWTAFQRALDALAASDFLEPVPDPAEPAPTTVGQPA